MSGIVGYLAGLSAEDIVARQYLGSGCGVQEQRWRSDAGEIDLIVRDGDVTVFVEVKKSRSFEAAALRITKRQMQRIYASAGAYLADKPLGLDSESRFDVALVDSTGAVQIVENAYMH